MAEARSKMTNAMRIVLAAGVLATAAGCSDDNEQLRAQIDEIKARPGGRIEPLPEVKPYETFAYPSADQRPGGHHRAGVGAVPLRRLRAPAGECAAGVAEQRVGQRGEPRR